MSHTFALLYVSRNGHRLQPFHEMEHGTAVSPLHVITQYESYFVKWIPKPSSTELTVIFMSM